MPLETPDLASTPGANEEAKRPMTFGRFLLYATGAVSATAFSYYFYKNDFNLHKTELAILAKLAELPLYYPPGPSESEKNTRLPQVVVPQGLVDQLSAWFIHKDTVLKDGVRRNDVLELFATLELVDPEKDGEKWSIGDEEFRKLISKSVSSFIEKGRGRLTEYKRLSGVSIQETIQLLNDMLLHHESVSPSIADSVGEKLHAILGALVESQVDKARGIVVESQADEKEMLAMELGQLEKAREALASKSSLSDAEQGRLSDLHSKIEELRCHLAKTA